jgi:phytoene synthase
VGVARGGMSDLAASYTFCRDIARRRAKNFYYSFLLLDRSRRDAMCAVYAFMRYCDDLSDEPGARREQMEAWRGDLVRALAGSPPEHPLWPAFLDTVSRFRIPHVYFHEMIDGVSSDLEFHGMPDFETLYQYCYRVASVVGLTIIHIFGFSDPKALLLAEKCGIAFQLTNILRDIDEDARNGRVYLPAEDLRRFGMDGTLKRDAGFLELMRFEAGRARRYYEESRPLIGMVEPGCRASLWALVEIYRRLLDRIEASGFDVFGRRIRLSTAEKIWILATARFRSAEQYGAGG